MAIEWDIPIPDTETEMLNSKVPVMFKSWKWGQGDRFFDPGRLVD
jgi:hypothetical protein